MLDKLSDDCIRTALRIAKKTGMRPFFGSPRGMIELRKEAERRGIFRTKNEEVRIMSRVYASLGSPDLN